MARKKPAPARRERRNQPRGYSGSGRRNYYGFGHDYVFYPTPWLFEGTYYEPGYYDETGKRYDGIAIKNEETTCRCQYCDSWTKVKWDGGPLPNCANCGAPLEIQAMEDQTPSYSRAAVSERSGRRPRRLPILIALILVIVVISGIFGAMQDSSYENDAVYYNNDEPEFNDVLADEIYVSEIGRSCPLLDDGNYYDEETGTYFWFNTYQNPAVWQYWVEGISEDFGDYGWMEYDDEEEAWYIEAEDGWELLPSGYDSSKLWHFNNAYENVPENVDF